jgi:DNA repair exonuclease SbcCD nuclease subunit
MNTLEVDAKDPTCIRGMGITDPHFTDIDPPAYKIDYMEMLETAFESVCKYAGSKGVDFFVWGGDIYHRKSARQNSHSLNARVSRIMRKARLLAGINCGIFGNHDYPFGDKMRGLQGQPGEMLLETGNYRLLDHEVPLDAKGEPMTEDHGDVLIRGDGFTLRIAGESYLHARAEPVRAKQRLGATWLLAVGHFWFGRQTGEFFGEPVYGPDFLSKGEPDAYFIGHHHEDQGVVELDGKLFASIGSFTRTGAHKHDRERRPSAVLFEFTKANMKGTILRPKHPKAEEALDLEMVEQQKAENAALDELTRELEAAESKEVNPRAILDELAPSAEIRKKTLEYLEKAESTE